eukprot:CAMPEP_0115656462 /NCGR_PEP_ID=MMETSP0272-20121206/44166_1 /TAXON_ID=71861 /ORGANISM="Scrippsiella trochoidea, Strain CCMP3099" /LENGTH=89 /DNA_ID=CAMNT_0003094437 /DNA_START=335 /DNA_END=602 /DNA_ORIENTATION=+
MTIVVEGVTKPVVIRPLRNRRFLEGRYRLSGDCIARVPVLHPALAIGATAACKAATACASTLGPPLHWGLADLGPWWRQQRLIGRLLAR